MASVNPHNALEVSVTGPGDWPARFGSVKDEFATLRSTCGLYHLAQRVKIQLTGNDRVRWLNGMVTNNIRDLAVGSGAYAFLLNPQGHILGDLTAYNRGDYFLVETDRPQLEKILATFDHYIIMDDVGVTNVSEKLATVGLAGPNSGVVLKTAGLAIPQLNALQIVDLSWRETTLSLIRGEHEQYPAYEIWVTPENLSPLREALQTAGASPVGRDALELYRMALGTPRYGQDIRERDLPQETEQPRALNFNKGCYVGQEIVERIRSRGSVHRKFTGFRVEGPPPTSGTKVRMQEPEKDIGEITSSARIPASDGDHTVALGYIRRAVGVPGKQVKVEDSIATVRQLPFADLLAV